MQGPSNAIGTPATKVCPPGGVIGKVEVGSPSAIAGLRAGDVLIAVNGRTLHDVLDYQFHSCEPDLILRVWRAGSELTFNLPGGDSLGLYFADSTFDGIRRCRNRCPFCFVTQLPRGMRRSLYVKDDDYRYSVGFGSFVTLTNLTEEDWERLAEQRLSPLRISIHATDLALRRHMLGNPQAPDIIQQLQRLKALGIQVHTQLVLCPGVNDGAMLERSVADLAAFYPIVQSIAVVPVGFTNQNGEGDLRSYDRKEAQAIVRTVCGWQRQYRSQLGVSLVYLADELYFLADRRFPAARQYDGYPQYANGIGLVRSLLDDWSNLRRRLPGTSGPSRQITMVCGTRIAPILEGIATELRSATRLSVAVLPVRNEFFGASVNVSGLLTGRDVLAAIRTQGRSDVLVLPGAMLDADGKRFLDDMTPADLESACNQPVAFAHTIREMLLQVKALDGSRFGASD